MDEEFAEELKAWTKPEIRDLDADPDSIAFSAGPFVEATFGMSSS